MIWLIFSLLIVLFVITVKNRKYKLVVEDLKKKWSEFQSKRQMVSPKARIFEKKSDRRSQFYSEYKLLDTYPLALYLFKKLHFLLNKAIQDNIGIAAKKFLFIWRCTLFCICLGKCCFGLETRVIIKHPAMLPYQTWMIFMGMKKCLNICKTAHNPVFCIVDSTDNLHQSLHDYFTERKDSLRPKLSFIVKPYLSKKIAL